MRYGRKLLHSAEYRAAEYRAAERLAQKQRLAAMTEDEYAAHQAHQTQLQRDRRERIKLAELARAWSRHEALLARVSLELPGARNAR